MTVTAVPLQPVRSSAIWTLWLGLVALLALAIGLALWTTGPLQGVRVETLRAGTGPSPAADDVVLINYVGKLKDGAVFDQATQAPMDLQGVVPGFAKGIVQMRTGGKYRLTIPARLGYGAEEKRDPRTNKVVIPANSDLVFDIELLEFKSRAEVMAIQRQIQSMQQQMMQQGGGNGGAPGGARGAVPPPPAGGD